MSADTDRLIAPLRELLAGDGWVPGSVAMNKLDALVAALEAAEAQRDTLAVTVDLVRRIAVYGPGEGTSPEIALATIASLIEKRAALAGVAPPEEQP